MGQASRTLTRRGLLAAAAAVAALGAGLPVLRRAWSPAVRVQAPQVDPVVGMAAPPLSGKGPGGAAADLSRYAGSVVLLNVWASWCRPCWQEMPLLLQAWQRWRGQGVVLFGLNTGDAPQPATEFLTRVGALEVPVVSDPDGMLAVQWGVRGVPETFAVNRSGMVAARRIGEVDQAWLDSALPPLL